METITTFCVWFVLVIFLGVSLTLNEGLSQGQQHHMKKTRSSAVVVGTVYCDTCSNGAFISSKSPNHLIPGALVAVECIDENSKPSFRQEVETNEHGEFQARLPLSVSKDVKTIKRCSVKLLSSSQPYCSIAASGSTSSSSSLKRLKSSNHGEETLVFSAGFFAFKPKNQPEICSQKPINLHVSKPLKSASLQNKKDGSLVDKKFSLTIPVITPPVITPPVITTPVITLPNIPGIPPALSSFSSHHQP